MSTYQVMPPLTPEVRADLLGDIALNGVRVPIDVDENGTILDGHHRFEIAEELGMPCPVRIITGLSEAQKVAHAYAVNIQRRSLTREQKRALVAASLRREPELSDREHAKRIGVSPTTVGDVRDELEESGDVSKLDTRTDSLGRQQSAAKPAKVTTTSRTTEATKVEQIVDTQTGEILTRADATARFPILDIPNAPDDDVVAVANQILTHTEDTQDYRAEQGAKWLAAQARKKNQDDTEPPPPLAASHFQRLADDVVILDRHTASMADAYQAADPFRREQWASAVDALLDRLTSLSVQMSSTPALRSVK